MKTEVGERKGGHKPAIQGRKPKSAGAAGFFIVQMASLSHKSTALNDAAAAQQGKPYNSSAVITATSVRVTAGKTLQ